MQNARSDRSQRRLFVTVPPVLRNRLERFCKETGLSKTNVVVYSVDQFLKSRKY